MLRAVPSGAAGGYTVRRIEHHPDTCPREQPRLTNPKSRARAAPPEKMATCANNPSALSSQMRTFSSLRRLRSKWSNSRRHADHARMCEEALRLEPHRNVANCPCLREGIGFSLVGITRQMSRALPRPDGTDRQARRLHLDVSRRGLFDAPHPSKEQARHAFICGVGRHPRRNMTVISEDNIHGTPARSTELISECLGERDDAGWIEFSN